LDRVASERGALDREAQGAAAVLPEAEAFGIAGGVSCLIEQLVGALGIIFDIGVAALGVVLWRLFERAVLSRGRGAIEGEFVDLLAVDRQREGDTHIAILEELAQPRVFGGVVGLEGDMSSGNTEHHTVIATAFVLFVEREVA